MKEKEFKNYYMIHSLQMDQRNFCLQAKKLLIYLKRILVKICLISGKMLNSSIMKMIWIYWNVKIVTHMYLCIYNAPLRAIFWEKVVGRRGGSKGRRSEGGLHRGVQCLRAFCISHSEHYMLMKGTILWETFEKENNERIYL